MIKKVREPFSGTLTALPSNKKGKALAVTIRGGEGIVGGLLQTFRYSVCRLQIDFDLSNCVLPEDDWAHDPITLQDRTEDHKATATQENSTTSNTEWMATAAVNPSSQVSHKRSGAKRNISSEERIYSTTYTPLLANGSSTQPSWTLTAETSNSPLFGTLIKASRFCRVEPTGDSPKVAISYTIPYDALLIRKPDGQLVSGNGFGIIRLMMRKHLCEKKIEISAIEI